MCIIKDIEKKYEPQKIRKCSEKQCSINMKGYPNKIILKGEKCIGNQEKICDCLIFIHESDRLIIPIVELKSNSIKDSDVIEKFYNTLRQCDKVICDCNNGNKLECNYYLILLAKSFKSTIEFLKLKDTKIHYGKRDYRIRFKSCGGSLKEIINI